MIYAALSMLDTGSDDVDAIVEDLNMAMDGVITAELSHCIRDAKIDHTEVHTGDYIGFVGKELLSVNTNRFEAVCETLERLDFKQYDICIVICGKNSDETEANQIESYITSNYPGKEVYVIDGMFIDWRVGLFAVALMLILLFTTKYMSLATVVAMLTCPIVLLIVNTQPSVVCIYAACVIFMAVRHKENFKRLLNGTESKFKVKTH